MTEAPGSNTGDDTDGNRLPQIRTQLALIRHDSISTVSLIACMFLGVVILYSLVVRIQMLALGTSLWCDEALLVENVFAKSVTQIVTPPLSNPPTTSIGYLLALKALVHVFGSAEWVLRLYSFVAFVLLLVVQGFVLRKIFHLPVVFVMLSLALTSVFFYYVDYSAEVKPYMGDAFFSILFILLYYLYRRRRIGPVLLGVALSVCLLFSSPAAFFIAGILLTEFAAALVQRAKRRILDVVFVGAISFVTFALHYFLWLRPISSYPDLVSFWQYRRFDFRFWDLAALSKDWGILRELLNPLAGGVGFLVLPLAAAGVIVALVNRNTYTIAILCGFALLTGASAVGVYPMENRLWMSLFAWVFMYAFVLLSSVRVQIPAGVNKPLATRIVALLIGLVLIASFRHFPDYGKGAEWTLKPGNQANALIAYVQDNIEPGEVLYSYYTANFVIKYKNGYQTDTIGPGTQDNIIWGAPLSPGSGDSSEISRIIDTHGAYVLFYHSYYPFSADPFPATITTDLQKSGYMDLIMDDFHTPLYWFTQDLSRVKASASLESPDLTAKDGTISGVFVATNSGKTVLRADGYGTLTLVIRKAEDPSSQIASVPFSQEILPGQSTSVSINIPDVSAGQYEADLVCQGEYSFSQLGMLPIPITVGTSTG